MPFYRRRRVAGRKYPKRRYVRRLPLMSKGAAMVRRMVPTNTIKIVRKGVTAHIYNNAAGTDFVTNSNWLTIGPKSAVVSSMPNYYNLAFTTTFRASDVYNWAELQPICEKFKLKYVKIYCYATSTTASVNGLGLCPTVLWDEKGVDDDTVPTYSAFKEQMGIKRKFLSQGKTAVMKPKLCVLGNILSGTAGVNSVRVQKPVWLDSNSVNAATEHYGLNGVFEDLFLAPQASSAYDIKFDIEYGLELRNVK